MSDAIITMAPVILRKPPYGAPCNGCGLCCHREVCAIGIKYFGDVPAPCPGLVWRNDKYRCAVMEAEEEMIQENPALTPKTTIKQMLGGGMGCDATTEEEYEVNEAIECGILLKAIGELAEVLDKLSA